MERTLFDKIFDDHVVADLGDGYALIHVDRHMIHDLLATGPLLVGGNGYPIRKRRSMPGRSRIAAAGHGPIQCPNCLEQAKKGGRASAAQVGS